MDEDNKIQDLINVFRGEKPIVVAVEPSTMIYTGLAVFVGMLLAILLSDAILKKW